MPPNLQRNKEWVVPLVCIVIVVGIVLIGQHSVQEPEKIQENLEKTPIVEWPSQQIKRETVSDSTKQYVVTAYYPVTQDEAITGYFRDFVNDQISAFKQNIGGENALPEGYPAARLDISYEERKSDRADNYVFVIDSDTGGAHGLTVTKTFSFSKAGQRIAIEDLFTTGTRGLGIIADYVQAELMKKEFADQKWISEGAAPTEQNYQNFVIENTGVTFIFDPYQVAAYAAGTQTVSVPTTAFKKIANPELFK